MLLSPTAAHDKQTHIDFAMRYESRCLKRNANRVVGCFASTIAAIVFASFCHFKVRQVWERGLEKSRHATINTKRACTICALQFRHCAGDLVPESLEQWPNNRGHFMINTKRAYILPELVSKHTSQSLGCFQSTCSAVSSSR